MHLDSLAYLVYTRHEGKLHLTEGEPMATEYIRALVNDIDLAEDSSQHWNLRHNTRREELVKRLKSEVESDFSVASFLARTHDARRPQALREFLVSMSYADWARIAGRIMDDIEEEEERNEREELTNDK